MPEPLETLQAARPRRFRPYPEMKSSGVEWLGEIPAHWEVHKLSRLTRCMDGKRIPLNAEERGHMKGEYPYWGANSVVDYVDRWIFDEELVLLGEDGAPFFDPSKPVAFHVSGKIWVNNHAHVLRPLPRIDGRFLRHSLNTVDYRAFIDGSTRDKLTQGDMNAIPIQVMPLDEQRAIATFLDRETEKIDALVAKKKLLIELLQEKRTALITRAVTRGLDPGVPMKDSGVEWLGEIPAHWEVRPVGWLAAPLVGFPFPSADFSFESGVPLVRGDNVTSGNLRWGSKTRYWPKKAPDNRYLLRENDIVIGMDGSKVGKNYAMIPQRDLPLLLVQRVTRLRTRNGHEPEYVFNAIATPRFHAHVDTHRTDPAIPHITLKDIVSYPVCVPPQEEQRAIAKFVGSESSKIDALTTKIREAIDHLQEFRTALISAAVTGKIDVREEVS